jgi:hypothetical protein
MKSGVNGGLYGARSKEKNVLVPPSVVHKLILVGSLALQPCFRCVGGGGGENSHPPFEYLGAYYPQTVALYRPATSQAVCNTHTSGLSCNVSKEGRERGEGPSMGSFEPNSRRILLRSFRADFSSLSGGKNAEGYATMTIRVCLSAGEGYKETFPPC